MFLSGMGMERLRQCLLVLALLTSSLCVDAASADARHLNRFCKTRVLHDYTRFLDGLPPLEQLPVNERLPFAPERVFFSSQGGGSLQPGSGYRYYSLAYSPWVGNPVPVPLDWQVTTTLTPIDEAGRAMGPARSNEQHVDELWPAGERGANRLSFGFDVPGDPAIYRLEVRIENGEGEQLGAYGEYFRVLRPGTNLRFSLNRRKFRPGQQIRATLANPGVAWFTYGLGSGIEFKKGEKWGPPPFELPKRYILAIALGLQPGESTSCWGLQIPDDAPPGRYRFSTQISRLTWPWGRETPRPVYAPFTILPRRDFVANTAVGRRTSRPAA